MSAVMTSLSMPSLGTKYSFVRAEAACARLSRSLSLSLPDMMRKSDENCCKKKERKPRNEDLGDAGHPHHVSLGRRGGSTRLGECVSKRKPGRDPTW